MEEINNLIEAFLKQKNLINNKNVVAVFAFGSRVSNTNSNNSDLDLQLIFNTPTNRRGATKINNVVVEYYYNTIESIINLEKLYYNNNSPLFARSLQQIYIYKNENHTVEKIKEMLKSTFDYNTFPQKNELYMQNQLIVAYNRLLDLNALKDKNSDEFYYLYYLTLERLKDFYCELFNFNKMEAGRYNKFFENSPNYQITKRIDAPFEILFKNCFPVSNPEDNFNKIQKLFEYIIQISPIKLDFNEYEIDFNKIEIK